MSFPLAELRRLLAPTDVLVGTVVAIDGDVARIATSRGAIRARAVARLAVGDRVRVEQGVALRAPVAREVFAV